MKQNTGAIGLMNIDSLDKRFTVIYLSRLDTGEANINQFFIL
ncbi:hypothetical protein [Hymenobacter tibetensis]|nr:hypothetical protein [Hymenobacter tibetensis]